ncbi:DUF3180 domain-containing protein [Nocardioides caldifontis]|uniref:DUF3180 domain-containing protein n=1 Tax=Nocardioides caldifontis TaxID=2588938 RepID=UPI001EF0F866|nr:DUF3180 domain-containing protein [Nocardioides caldifontis]
MVPPLPGPPEEDEAPQRPEGRLRTTRPGLLVGLFLAGVVVGRLVRPLAATWELTAPRVTWVQGAVLYLAATILFAVARATHVAVHQRRERLLPHQAVNRLVLAKSCALTGAAVAGGYVGYALGWVGAGAELARERVVLSLVAALGAALVAVGALLLERACRVRDDDEAH